MNGWTLALFIISFIPVYIFTAFTPYFVRRTESFGVSIPSDVFDHPELKALRRKFAAIMLITGLIFCAGSLLFWDHIEWTASAAVIGYLIVFFVIYIRFHRQMKKLKQTNKWFETKKQAIAVDLNFQNKRTIVSNGWFSIGLLIWIATVICTFVFYDRIPDPIPMQYDFQGNVTNWADKSMMSVMSMPLTQLIMLVIFIFVNTIISKSKQQLDPSDPETSAQHNLIFRRRWSIFIVSMGNAMVLLFAFIQLFFMFTIDMMWTMMATTILVGGTIAWALILSVTTGQGGSRIQKKAASSSDKINRDDDQHWKLGMFYFNPDDPALFLEKRFGVGWTVNLARPIIWFIVIGILVLAFLPALLI